MSPAANPRGIRRRTALAALLLGPRWLASAAANTAAGLGPQRLQLAFDPKSFTGINIQDAEAAFKGFVRTAAIQRGYETEVVTRLFEGAEELQAAIHRGQVDLLIVDSWLLIEMDRALVTPMFVATDRGEVAKRYSILTRTDSGLNTLADLKGKTLNLIAAPNAHLGHHWLRVLLGEGGFGSPESFLNQVHSYPKASSVVLPVFFGKKDACLVDSTGFDLMAELNPQVGKSLRPIVHSEPLAHAVTCTCGDGWSIDRFKLDVLSTLAKLDATPTGQQILTLFRSGPLVPFEETHLDSVRRLHARMLHLDSPSLPPNGPAAPAILPAQLPSQR